jgi:hypothetical protein
VGLELYVISSICTCVAFASAGLNIGLPEIHSAVKTESAVYKHVSGGVGSARLKLPDVSIEQYENKNDDEEWPLIWETSNLPPPDQPAIFPVILNCRFDGGVTEPESSQAKYISDISSISDAEEMNLMSEFFIF